MKKFARVGGVLLSFFFIPFWVQAGDINPEEDMPVRCASKGVDIALNIDEQVITEEQREVLSSLQTPHVIELFQVEEAAATPSARASRAEIFHKVMNVISDLCAMGAATLVPVSTTLGSSEVLQVGMGLLLGNFTIDFFRVVPNVIPAIQQDPTGTRALCFYGSSIGQIGAIAGFSSIAAGVPIEIGAWTATGSLMLKLASLAYQMRVQGLNSPFGNSHTLENMIFRVAFLSGTGTLGGILLAVSTTTGNSELGMVGAYILGVSILIGTGDVLYRDLEALDSLRSR